MNKTCTDKKETRQNDWQPKPIESKKILYAHNSKSERDSKAVKLPALTHDGRAVKSFT